MNVKYIDIQNLDAAILWFHEVFKKANDYSAWIKTPEDKAVELAIGGMGDAMTHLLGFWINDPPLPTLVKYFNQLGIYYGTDMTEIVIRSYHRKINGNDININQQVKKIRDYWDSVSPKMNEGLM